MPQVHFQGPQITRNDLLKRKEWREKKTNGSNCRFAIDRLKTVCEQIDVIRF